MSAIYVEKSKSKMAREDIEAVKIAGSAVVVVQGELLLSLLRK